MAQPLELVTTVAKEFGIKGNKALHVRQQLAYAAAQAEEQRVIINRLIVDVSIARNAGSNAKDDVTKAAHQAKVNQYEADLRQLSKTLDFFIALEEDLTKVNKNEKAEVER